MSTLLLAAALIAGSPPETPQDLASFETRAQAYYHFSLSQWHRLEGDDEEAIQELHRALEYDSDSSSLHFSLAQTLADTGRLEDAERECRRAIELDPEDSEPHFLLGLIHRSHFQRGEADMLPPAIQELQTAVDLGTESIEAYSALGQLYMISRRWEEAARVYQHLLQLRPDLPRVELLYAQALTNSGEIEKAIESLQSLKPDPEVDPERLSLLAHLLATADRGKEAVATYREAIRLSKEDQTRWGLQFSLGQLLISEGRFLEAEEALQEVVNGGSTDPQARVELGKAQEGARHFRKAIESFQKVLEEEPDNIEANYYLASSFRNLGRRDEAIERLLHLLAVTEGSPDTPGALLLQQHHRDRFRQFLGLLYQETRQYGKAIEVFRQLAAENPENVQTQLGLIYALKDAGQLDEARQLSSQLVATAPDDMDVLITHARILSSAGDLEAGSSLLREQLEKELAEEDHAESAEEYYLALSQLHTEQRDYSRAKTFLEQGLHRFPESQRLIFQLGAVYERLNQVAAAEQEFKKVLDSEPEHAPALNYLGYMLADRDMRLEEARQYIQRALDLDPHNGAYLDSLGWVYFKMNQLALAEENLKLAIQVNDSDPTILEHLGDLYVRLGDRSTARDYYRKSISFAEDPQELKQVETKLARLEKESSQTRRRATDKP